MDLVQVDVQNSHLEVVGTVSVLVVDIDQAEEFLAQVHFHAVVLLVARTDVDVPIAELLLQKLLELDDFRVVHGGSFKGIRGVDLGSPQ